jgi:hypothetical protein
LINPPGLLSLNRVIRAMQTRKRIRKRSFLKKHKILMLFLSGVGAFLFSYLLANRIRNSAEVVLPERPINENSPMAMGGAQLAGHERTVYPYSVISGGVRSREELAAQIAGDPVVAEHYKNFNLREARMVRAEEARMMYVSYRLRNKVYWTAKKLSIPKGEALITDGKCEARARCGNQVSAAPQEPVSEEEPIIETFDLPKLARMDQPSLDPVPVAALEFNPVPPLPALGPSVSSLRPAILPYYYRPLFVVRPSTVVPESGTLALLFTGLVALFATRFARKK